LFRDLKKKIIAFSKKNPDMKNLKIAIMGCSVNGPGEAKLADCGVAFGKDKAIFFIKGESMGTFSPGDAVKRLIDYVKEEDKRSR